MNTMVPIFHTQNLLHILKKKEKTRIKFLNFSQKYMGTVFEGGYPVFEESLLSRYLSNRKIGIKGFEVSSTCTPQFTVRMCKTTVK